MRAESIYSCFLSNFMFIWKFFEGTKKEVIVSVEPKENFITKWVYKPAPKIVQKFVIQEEGFSLNNLMTWWTSSNENEVEEKLTKAKPSKVFESGWLYNQEPVIEEVELKEENFMNNFFAVETPEFEPDEEKLILENGVSGFMMEFLCTIDPNDCLMVLVCIGLFLWLVHFAKLLMRSNKESICRLARYILRSYLQESEAYDDQLFFKQNHLHRDLDELKVSFASDVQSEMSSLLRLFTFLENQSQARVSRSTGLFARVLEDLRPIRRYVTNHDDPDGEEMGDSANRLPVNL